jgi:aspartyl-tRNA(Asn)/glutamyl-tRNA(Gln) amidotransferase subunit A
MIAFASSLDQAGPIARTAEDCALLLESMAGFDPMDSTCIDKQVPKYSESLTDSIKGLRIGLPKQYFNADINSEVGTLLDNALNELKRSGANLVEVDLPHAELAIPTYYVVAPAECSTNLSRYDGVRYGYRCEDPKDLKDLYCRSRSEAFGDEVKRRILVGTYVLSAGFYDAYYRQAQKIRRLVQQDYITAFEKADLIASPAALSTAFKFGEKTAEPVEMYQEDLYTIPANLAGLPAMSMPCGLIKGLPIGMQFVGRQFEEARMLNAAHQYQMLTDWHTLSPSKFGGAK